MKAPVRKKDLTEKSKAMTSLFNALNQLETAIKEESNAVEKSSLIEKAIIIESVYHNMNHENDSETTKKIIAEERVKHPYNPEDHTPIAF